MKPIKNVSLDNLEEIIFKKAIRKFNHVCHKLIIAIGFDSKGKVICIKTNKPPLSNIRDTGYRPGAGRHAEEEVIKHCDQNKLVKILVVRVKFNIRGKLILVPMEPCSKCRKIARKYDIELIPWNSEKI